MAGRRTILMVEDEESITEPLAEALDREGFDTRVAGTVADATLTRFFMRGGGTASGPRRSIRRGLPPYPR